MNEATKSFFEAVNLGRRDDVHYLLTHSQIFATAETSKWVQLITRKWTKLNDEIDKKEKPPIDVLVSLERRRERLEGFSTAYLF